MDLVREIDAIAAGTDQTRVVAMPLDERSDAAQEQSVLGGWCLLPRGGPPISMIVLGEWP